MSSRRATKPRKILFVTNKQPKQKLRYNCYTKQYVLPQQPKTSTAYNKHIKYSSEDSTDCVWVGDTMSPEPNKRATRFWFQNCHGLMNANDSTRFHFEMTSLIEQNIHYLGFAETNINNNHTFTKFQIENSFKSLTDHGRFDLNNTPGFSNKSFYQPGGVGAGFHGRICNRYPKTSRDPCGRWISHVFIGKTNTLKNYTVYRVNPKPPRGDTTAWQQQKLYLQRNQQDLDPRKQVIDDLLASLQRDRDN